MHKFYLSHINDTIKVNNPESLQLAKTLHSARQLTKHYLGKSEGVDLQKRFKVGSFETNSIHWIVAHLAWAEDFLILQGTGNKSMNVKWFDDFKFGATHPDKNGFPPFEEAMRTMDEVHKNALDIINNLSAEDLKAPNHVGLKFGPSDSKEALIQHTIRHEASHSGQLWWLLRMQGVEKII